MLDLILPALRADYRVVETYRRTPGPRPSCPLRRADGRRRPQVTPEEARAWEQETDGPFELHVYPGAHFTWWSSSRPYSTGSGPRCGGSLPAPERWPDPCTRSSTRSCRRRPAPRTSRPLPLPESYRAITVHKDETDMFAGMRTRDKDPRKSLHLDEVPVPELRAGRGPGGGDGLLGQLQLGVVGDLRAAADLRIPGALRPAQRADEAARPAVPRHRLRPGRRGAADRSGGAGLEAR